ncbi:MAG: EamA family transporter [Bacteroidota bacterium]|nr:EamA family transporter [Bacteroidota bacterium]MDX5429892.1 EamA family transporter [Bacteroidota bacterium]MDX5468666.1 EamA family transporter [Bacteroidota bacterium]
MSKELKRAFLFLHIAVFLFGFTAILGKLITLREVMLVWHRLWITCLSIAFIPGVILALKKMTRKEIIRFMGIGLITCMHWLAFYGSIKLSNVSIALSCLATTSLFTSLIEPWLFKRRINPLEVVLGIAVTVGIIIITRATFGYKEGIIAGLIAALLASLFSTLNKKYMENHHPITMTLLELGTGFLFITALLPVYLHYVPDAVLMPAAEDWGWLLILSILCTSVAYVLALLALKEISAFTANLAINLEPVYGILLAIPIFQEHKELDWRFYLGTGIILFSVFLYPVIRRAQRKKAEKAALVS